MIVRRAAAASFSIGCVLFDIGAAHAVENDLPLPQALFDGPVNAMRIPLPGESLSSQKEAVLSCFQFRNFAVKQLDLGEKGASQLSIIPAATGEKFTCTKENAAKEIVIQGAEWGGYFKGVKENFVFFDADDGVDGGLGFAIFEPAHGVKLFSDKASGELHSLTAAGNGLTLRYTRVYRAPCSLYADAKGCWRTVREKTGIIQAQGPDCVAAYKASADFYKRDVEEDAGAPSVVEYEVEVALDAGRATVTAIPSKIECRVSD
jgi:hypothetical protein